MKETELNQLDQSKRYEIFMDEYKKQANIIVDYYICLNKQRNNTWWKRLLINIFRVY